MVKRGRARSIDPAQALRYRTVGESLLRSAGGMVELSDLDRYYGNAIAIVCIHAVIAYNDALTVAFGGVKSTEGDHARAADLLQSALGPRASPEMVKLARSLLTLKDRVSYQGQYYTGDEAVQLFRRADEFCAWAERMYQERP
jgi:hypothetical protein